MGLIDSLRSGAWLCWLGRHQWSVEPPWNEVEFRTIPYCTICERTYADILDGSDEYQQHVKGE